MARLLAPVTAVLFMILTSTDVTTLVMVVLHLPPPLALEAALLLGLVLVARRVWRRWTGRPTRMPAPATLATVLLTAAAFPHAVVLWPLSPWLRLTLHSLKIAA